MSFSLSTRSTIPSSSFTSPNHSKVKRRSSIQFGKKIAYTCSEQKQNIDGDEHTIDRRKILLGLGGLFGAASANMGNKGMTALASDTVSPEKQKLIKNVKFWWWKRERANNTESALPIADDQPTNMKMHAEVSSELVVKLPADEIWAVYSSPDLPRLIVELLPDRFEKIDILEGDGGVGTILHCVLNAANSGPRTWNEKIIKIDDATRTKVVRQIEGGYLDLGFHLYEHIFTITEKDANSCIIRMTASFCVDEKSASNASIVNPNWGMGKAIANYVVQKKAKDHNNI